MKSQSVLKAADIQERNKLINSLGKIKEEELRYGKAYGEGALEFEQLKELLKECKKKRASIQIQLDKLNSKASQEVDQFQVDDI